MKTALVVSLVVVAYALVVTLTFPVFGPRLGLDRFAESWVLGALFSSSLLAWSFVLVTGFALAAVIVVAWRILQGRCVALRRNG